MQMFLWTGNPSHEVVVGRTSYAAAGATFGPPLNATGITAEVALADDGTAPTVMHVRLCQPAHFPASSRSSTAVSCTFVVKVKNAQNCRGGRSHRGQQSGRLAVYDVRRR